MGQGSFRFIRCGFEGIEAMEADSAHAFCRHTHERFGIGLIERGAHRSASGRGVVEAEAGDVITVNPGEVHDGVPVGDGGRSWRMLYLDPALVAQAADDLEEGGSSACEFTRPAIRDRRMAGCFRILYQMMTTGSGDDRRLKADETLLVLLSGLVERKRPVQRWFADRIRPALDMIDDDPAARLTLANLADQAGISRFQLVRGFARATGLTPHAYLMQRRLQLARQLIGSGVPLGQAAAASGFSDQSHMTRLFVRSFGLAPGAYARAVT